MQILILWGALAAGAALLARSARRRYIDAWPAYAYALPLAARVSTLVIFIGDGSALSVHDWSLIAQGLASAAFVALMVVLFATRSTVMGQRASRGQALVALAGTLALNLVALVPVEANSANVSLVLSSLLLCVGTLFATWSLAVLGPCFGILPEVRGLVRRGPYRWVRHPVYLGEIIAAVGVVFARPHVLTAILLLAFVGLQWWRTVFEERALAHAFPGEYPSYQMGVSRLLPRFRLSGEKHVSSVPVT